MGGADFAEEVHGAGSAELLVGIEQVGGQGAPLVQRQATVVHPGRLFRALCRRRLCPVRRRPSATDVDGEEMRFARDDTKICRHTVPTSAVRVDLGACHRVCQLHCDSATSASSAWSCSKLSSPTASSASSRSEAQSAEPAPDLS